MKVVFVCSGNICRSPMAAAYCRHRVSALGLDDLEVDSAGTLGIDEAPASAESIEVMGEIGVDLSSHRSRGLGAKVLHDADYTIAMDWGHLETLARRYPDGEDERLLLRAFENGPEIDPNPSELADPIGHDIEFYRELRPIVTSCVDHLLERIASR